MENAGTGYVYGGGVTASVRNDPSGFSLMSKALAEGVLPVLATEVAAAPNACPDPDTCYEDHDDDKKDDPLVM